MANISNSASNTIIAVTNESNYVVNTGSNVTIITGEGDDTVYTVDGDNVRINSGAGSDNIGVGVNHVDTSTGKNVTVNAGAGVDNITSMSDRGILYEYNLGDDINIINGFNSNDTLQISGSTYTTMLNGDNFVVSVDSGAVILKNCANLTVNIKDVYGNLNTYNSNPSNILYGTDSADVFTNTSKNASVVSYAGNDKIWSYADRVFIHGGDDHDDIVSYGNTVNAYGGNGADSIVSYGNNGFISGGTGNDTLIAQGSGNTLEGSIGDDVIIIDTDHNAINYSLGDGYDTVYGFNASDVLWIYDAAWSQTTNGNDIIVNLQNGSVTLKNASGINPRIALGITDNAADSTITKYTKIIDASTRTQGVIITCNELDNEIYGGAGNDELYGGAGDDIIFGNADDDKLFGEAGNDYLSGGTGNDSLYSGDGYNTLNGGTGNDYIDVNEGNNLIEYTSGDGYDTVDGFKVTDTLQIDDGTGIYFAKKIGNDIFVTVGEGTIMLKSAANLSTVNILGTDNSISAWTLNGTVATYGTWNKTLITVSGVKSLDGLALKDKVVTVSAKALDTDKVKISDGYTLALADDVTKTSTTAAGWTLNNSTATYKNSATSAGYSSDGKNISYVAASGGETLVTVSGVKSTDGLALKDKVVTVSAKALGTDKVTISDGYTLALANDVTKTSTTAAGWTINSSTATYKNSATSASYKLSNNQISYVAASGGNTLATVKGVKSTNGLKISGKKITVSKSALGTSKVTVNDGYTLALGSDVTKSKTTTTWNLSKTTATYKQTTTEGYTLVNNAINYSKKSEKTLATVKGVKATDGLKISGKKITVSKSALGTSKVTVSDGYTLKLGSDVSKSKTTKAWNLSKSTATYKQTTIEGYTLADNAINYSKKSEKTLATVKGVKSTDGLKISGKKITVSKSALGTSKVTVSNGYKLKLGSDVSKPSTSKAWNLDKTTATYKQTTTAGYSLVDNAINYTKSATKTLATVDGVNSTKGISAKNNVVTLKASSLDKKVTVNGSGYEFNFASGDYKKTSITGGKKADVITARGKNISIDGGAGADTINLLGSATTVNGGKGNDIISGSGKGNYSLWGGADNDTIYSSSGADKFIYAKGDGKDVIFGFDDKDTLTIDNLDFTASYSKKNGTITFKVDNGSIMLKDFTAKAFHVNDEVYKISGSKFVKK